VALAAALSGAVCHGAAAATGPTPTMPPPASTATAATWTQHSLTFAYQGMTTQYSCEGLKQKMGALLRYFGARPESIRLRTYGCAGGPYRPSPAINLAMDFETLAPSPADGATDAVRGGWIERDLFGKTRISRQAPSSIGRGDCELVEKFVASVLPSFTHEIVRNLTRCIPHELNGTMPNLRVRVLAPETDRSSAVRPFPLTLRADSRQ
jgi:hypothetical protein